MNVKRNIKRTLSTVVDVKCNSCGNSCIKSKQDLAFEFATIHAAWGYFSNKRDGEVHEAHLCQSCFEKLIKKFAIPTLIAEDAF